MKAQRWRPIAGDCEVDLDVDPETAARGQKLGKAALALDAHGLQDPEMASQARLMDDARLIDRADELGGRAVHDRRFRSVDFDQDVVDLQAGQRREQMLDRADAGARRIAQHRAERGLGHVRPLGFEQPLTAAGQAGAQEDDAGVDVRGMENELSRRRRMDSDAGHLDPAAERLLKAWLHRQLSPGERPAQIGDAECLGAGSPHPTPNNAVNRSQPPCERPATSATRLGRDIRGRSQRGNKSPLMNKSYKLAAIFFLLYFNCLNKISGLLSG